MNWFNQPGATTTNRVVVPTTSSPMPDLNVDVTAQVASMVNNNANHGSLLKPQTEVMD